MKILILSIALLLLLVESKAQESTALKQTPKPIAVVKEVKGVCHVRANGAAKPRRIKAEDTFNAGEQLQCELKGKVVLRFQNGGIKEVATTSPDWFAVPNVPRADVSKSVFKPASRSKGDPLPPLVQPVAVEEPGQTAASESTSTAFDEVADYWTSRKKYYLMIAVSPSLNYKTDEFTKTDSNAVSATLKNFGYQELTILKGQQPTQDNVVSALQKIRDLGEDALVLVYYSGHAVTDGRDLWLQLAGQQEVGDHRGLSVTDLIGSARGNSFKGELAIVLDTCYSGQGLRSNRISLQDVENTTIFASSNAYQRSFTKTLESGVEISAFTYYLIRGLGQDFKRVDGDNDGIIEYVDLQRYISNKLIEDYASETLPAQMKPQVLSHAQRGWIAYDSKAVRNRDTEARRSLILETNSTLTDPEKLELSLPDPLPDNASPYLRALGAMEQKNFVGAWKLLQDAENEKSVSLAQINWTRAYVKLEEGQLGPARLWIQRAIDTTRKPPPDLLLIGGGLNLLVGHLVEAEQLLKRGIAANPESNAVNSNRIYGFLGLVFINLMQGDRKECELYIAELRAIGPKALDKEEEGMSSILSFIDVVTSMLSEKSDSALTALNKLKSGLKDGDPMSGPLAMVIDLLEGAIRSGESESHGDTPEPVAARLSEKDLQDWKKSLSKKDASELLTILLKVHMSALSPRSKESIGPAQVRDLLKQSVEFTGQLRKQTVTVTDSAGTRELEIEPAEHSQEIENAQILALLGNIYLAIEDPTEAESLYKQSIALMRGVPGGPILSLQSILGLSNFYQSNGRGEDAARLLRKLLEDMEEPFGELSWLSFMIHQKLADIYQGEEQWEKAEASYRRSLEIALTLFGSSGVLTDMARESVADFLVARERNAEAAQLLEEMIALLEAQRETWPVLTRDSVGDAYFNLGKTYHRLQRLEQAESALLKALNFLSKREDPSEAFECLHWRWATLHTLKRTAQADEVYKALVKIVNDEVEKKKASTKLVGSLLTTAVWFRDSNETHKADELLQAGLKLQLKTFGPESEAVANVRIHAGYLKYVQQSYGAAHSELQLAERIYRKVDPLPTDRLSEVLLYMGQASYQRQEYAVALAELEEALKLSGTPPNQLIRFQIAVVQRATGQLDAARVSLLALLAEAQKDNTQVDRVAVASAFLELTAIARLQNVKADVDTWLGRAESVLAEVGTTTTSSPVFVNLSYEQALRDLQRGKLKQGEQLLKETIERGRNTPTVDLLMLADAMQLYSGLLRQRGKESEALEMDRQANEIKRRAKL